jgi:RNA polymerase sigma factor (sigma-70 family)
MQERDPTMIGPGFLDGVETADPNSRSESVRLAEFAMQTRTMFISMARRWIRQFHIDEIGLAAEGAVQNTWQVLLRRLREGSLRPIQTLADFKKAFTHLLRNVVRDERRRQKALKRARSQPILDSVLDAVASHAVRPDDYVIGEQQAEWLLAILQREDASLREISILKMQGFSNGEIATKQDVSISTIERLLREIRSILGPYSDDRKKA